MKRPDEPATPSSRRLLVDLGVRLLVVLAFAWLVGISGLAGAGDDLLRDTYYDLRGLRALASITDGVAWSRVPALLRWLVLALLCTAAMIAARRLATAATSLTAAAIVLALLAADYVLFAAWALQLGATLPVLSVLAAIALEQLSERRSIRRHVEAIAQWTRHWTQLASLRTDVPDDEPAYWHRVAGLAQLYLGCTSTIVAERLPNRTTLDLRVIHGTTADQIAEQRRDIRRTPYRQPHLSLGPVWHDKFMAHEQSTLLVPLVVQHQLLGFWIINFESRDAVTAPHLALINTLAREIAMALDRRRAPRTPVRPPHRLRKILGAGRSSLALEEVRRAFAAHTQHQQALLSLGESMPFGVFIATLWGELRYMNPAMKLVCKQEGLDPASTNLSLPDVLCRLTGFPATELHAHLRKLVQSPDQLHLHGYDRIDRAGRDFVLSWLSPSVSDPPNREQLIVVCALPPRAERRTTAAADVYAVSSSAGAGAFAMSSGATAADADAGAIAADADADVGIATAALAAVRMSPTLSLKPHLDKHAATALRLQVEPDHPDPAAGDTTPFQPPSDGQPAPDPSETRPMFKFTTDDSH